MYGIIPLAAISTIAGFNSKAIDTEPHYRYTNDNSLLVWPWRTYKTSSHTPPHVRTTNFRRGELADGYWFVSPANQKTNDGTFELTGTGFVFDTNGDLIYAAEEHGMEFCDAWVPGMTDFRAQEYNGRTYITYWNGCNIRGAHWGHRWGRVTFMDDEFNNFTLNPDLNINTMDPMTRGQIDLHEHEMTDRNTMLVTSYNNTQHDLTSIGGAADAWVADSLFFELDPKTGEVIFEWHALDHMKDFRASKYGFHGNETGSSEKVPWDWLHINSVQKVGDNYLISARHHWALYLISGKDGSAIWKLDGMSGGTFGSIPANFRWQHHARAHNVTEHGMTVSLFNNMVNGPKNQRTQTNGMAFWIPMPPSRKNPPQLVRKLQTPGYPLFSSTQGSYQFDVGNGNGFIGYGTVPKAREYSAQGRLLWEAQFGQDKAVMSYRVSKHKWHATPKNWDPVVVFENPRILTPRVYVSWNGATDISGWAVYGGDDSDNLKSMGIAKKQGFETVFDLRDAQCVQLGAIRNKEIIRTSNVACLADVEEELEQDELEALKQRLDAQNAEFEAQKKILEAEKAELEAKKEQLVMHEEALEQEENDLEDGAWDSYRLFAEVAVGTIVVVIGAWAYVLWRDWRQRRQYEPVEDSLPPSFGFGLPRSMPKRVTSASVAETAADYDETRLDDLGEKTMAANRSAPAEDDESRQYHRRRLSVRQPFVRQNTGMASSSP